jgi:hypothetical protein
MGALDTTARSAGGVAVKHTIPRPLFWTPHIILATLFAGVMYAFALMLRSEGQPPAIAITNLLISAVPVGVVFFALGLLATVAEQEYAAGRMSLLVRRLLFWTPRIATILFAAFFSLFALDVFGAGYGFWESLLAFVIHAGPALLVLAALAVSWRWEWLGGALFLLTGALLLVRFGPGWGEGWMWYLTIAAPLLLIGALYLVGWRYRAELRGGAQPA